MASKTLKELTKKKKQLRFGVVAWWRMLHVKKLKVFSLPRSQIITNSSRRHVRYIMMRTWLAQGHGMRSQFKFQLVQLQGLEQKGSRKV